MKKIKNKLFIVTLVLFLINLIVFGICSFFNWSLLTGIVMGFFISVILYNANKIYVYFLLSKRRSFKFSFLISFLKLLTLIIILGGTLIGILYANKIHFNSWIDGAVNIFTFLYGCVLIPLAIIIYNLFDKKNKKENING